MKIVQLLYNLASGGAEISAVDLAIALKEEGADVTVITVVDSEDPLRPMLEKRLTAAGVGYERIQKVPHQKSLGPVIRYLRIIRRLRPDIVHSHCSVPTWLNGCLTSLANRRAKRVCTLHITYERFIRTFPANLIRPWNNFHRVVCVSQAVMDMTESVPNKSVIPVARNLSPFLHNENYLNREKLRQELSIEEDESVFLNVASMGPKQDKNHEGLIRGFALLPKEFAAKLILVGNGPLREYLEELSSSLGMAKRIHFAGIQADVGRYYSLADVLVMPSLFEGRPLAAMEAQVAGLPCLFSRIEPLLLLGKGVSGVEYFEDTGPESISKGLAQAQNIWGATHWRRPEAERGKLANEYGIRACLRSYLGPEGYGIGSIAPPSSR